MRYYLSLAVLLFVAGCSAIPQATNAPCRIFAHHISRVPADVLLYKTTYFEDEAYYFYRLTAPFTAATGVTLPVNTSFAATMPLSWCKYNTVKLLRLPGALSWFPAQGVIMQDKKNCYFSMLVIPANANLLKNSHFVESEASDYKAVVRVRK